MNLKKITNNHMLYFRRISHLFLGYLAALNALKGVVAANLIIKEFKVLDPVHEKTLTLDR
jgi:hypothetical protein